MKKLIILGSLAGVSLLHLPLSAVAQPVATTQPATSITSSSATINGTVNPNGALAVGYYQYGLTTSYGDIGGFMALPAGKTAQTLPGLVVNGLEGLAGADWTATSAPDTNYWSSIASSADGTRLAAVVGGLRSTGGIYTSTNSGNTWTLSGAPVASWMSIASSADGTRLAAVDYSGPIYTSTNGGATWMNTSAPANYWYSIASSADGTRLAAVSEQGNSYIYVSTNSGATWLQTGAPSATWVSIASSADGMRLAAAQGTDLGEGIYISTDGGATWSMSPEAVYSYNAIACSADGLTLIASDDGVLFFSTNGGGTWTQGGPIIADWGAVAASADGSILTAGVDGGGLYISTDRGSTWSQTGAPGADYDSIASSADGTKLAAVSYPGSIYTSAGTTNNLTAGTTYHYRVVGLNSAGTGLGSDLTFYIPGAPMVATLAASNVTSSIATVSGTVNPYDAASTYYFRYGLTTNYGSYSATNSLTTATNVALPVSGMISNLIASTNYHIQLVASNRWGMSLGNDLSFYNPGEPVVTTMPATEVTGASAYLNGSVNPNGAPTTAWFKYGLSTNYGSYSATNTLAATNVTLSVSNLVGTLVPGTNYHFQLVAGNSFGTNAGADQSFTTGGGAPLVTTVAASGITGTSAYLNGSVNPNSAAASAYFKYGLTTNYGNYTATNSLPAATVASPVFSSINNLTPGATYHFRLVASNIAGISLGNDLTFTMPLSPTVSTLPATGITTSNAILNSSVNPNWGDATAYYQYGLTTNYGSEGGFTSFPTTNTTLNLPGLAVSSLQGAAGSTWTQTSLPFTYWYSIASSADGMRLVAVQDEDANGLIFNSTDGGVTWTQVSGAAPSYSAIACSADGLRLALALFTQDIWTSTNAGTNWTLTSAPSNQYWYAIASSADGNRLTAGMNPGGVYTSEDGGNTWTQTSLPSQSWYSISSSADGSRLAAVADNTSAIWTSTNGGINWKSNSVPEGGWTRVVSSADGTQLAACAYGGGIYLSTNSGSTWAISSAPVGDWRALACSADGTRLVAGIDVGGLYTSTNSGLTWTAANAPSSNTWLCVASSADGTRLAALQFFGNIYTSAGATNTFAPGTSFHYRAVGVNSAGTGYGSDMTLTLPLAPLVTTLAASNITATTATLNGAVNPNWGATTAYFKYGLTTNYGSISTSTNLAPTNSTISVTNLISGLAPVTTYHFQLVAGNVAGTNSGGDQTFTTGAEAPTATISATLSASSTYATVHGTVNPNGSATTFYFQYGVMTNYGSYSVTNSLAATNFSFSVSDTISNLTPATMYYYQLVANNSAGTSVSAQRHFSTTTDRPAITGVGVSGVTTTNATLTANVNSDGNASIAYFVYGLTTNYGGYSATNSLAATNIALSISNLLSSLNAGTTYHFELVASNTFGTTRSGDVQFATLSQAQAVNFSLNGVMLPSGAFQFSFTNLSGLSFTVLATTNVALPLTNWTVLGTPTEAPPGLYQFADPQATNSATRFYDVRWP